VTALRATSPNAARWRRRRDVATTARIMSRVPRTDTKPEIALRRALWRRGLRGWRLDVASLPGRPDVCFARAKLAVFVDGAFWHGHPSKFHAGVAGPYWDEKIWGNRLRDRRTNRELRRLGWHVVRVWDFEVAKDAVGVADRVALLYDARVDEVAGDLVRDGVR